MCSLPFLAVALPSCFVHKGHEPFTGDEHSVVTKTTWFLYDVVRTYVAE